MLLELLSLCMLFLLESSITNHCYGFQDVARGFGDAVLVVSSNYYSRVLESVAAVVCFFTAYLLIIFKESNFKE